MERDSELASHPREEGRGFTIRRELMCSHLNPRKMLSSEEKATLLGHYASECCAQEI
jgi:hypothetical protein